MKIGVIGSVNTDLMYSVSKAVQTGETIIGETYKTLTGGKGSNQAVMMQALESNTVFLGAVGNDVFGSDMKKSLADKGLNTDNILVKNGPSGLAIIQVLNNDNSIVVVPGANMKLTKDDVDAFLKEHQDIKVLVLQLEIDIKIAEYAIIKAQQSNIKVILNPAPVQAIAEDILDRVDYLIPNETETETLFKTSNYEEMVRKFNGRLIITLGKDGVMFLNGNVPEIVPARTIDVVDTTGAGDSFVAGFAVGIARGYKVEDACKLGTEVASITCQHYGAQSAYSELKGRKL